MEDAAAAPPHFVGAVGVVEPGDTVGEIQLQLNHLAHSFTAAVGVLQRDAPTADEASLKQTVST